MVFGIETQRSSGGFFILKNYFSELKGGFHGSSALKYVKAGSKKIADIPTFNLLL